MGARIAAHFANAGIPSYLLDVVAPGNANRNSVAAAGLDAAKKSKPAAFMDSSQAKLVTLGNFEDDLPRLAEVDWIIEAIVEKLDIKRDLLKKVETVRKPGTIVTSNTSGLPINKISEGFSDDFRHCWFGTHFFNPPRYMRLLEIISTPETDPACIAAVTQFADTHLGKGIVFAKDTPNFIANRIGTFSVMNAMRLMQEMDLSIEEVDALTGQILGWPKSATFRTIDLVGLDILANVAGNMQNVLDERGDLRLPDFVQQMLQRKWLGDKTKAGFYKKQKSGEGKDDDRLALDWKALEYRPRQKPKFPSLEMAKNVEETGTRLRMLLGTGAGSASSSGKTDKAAAFLWAVLSDLWTYCANRIPEISDSIVEIDRAMRLGFNWEMGPFELWDAAGVEQTVERMKREGKPVAANVEELMSTVARYLGAERTRESFASFALTRRISLEPQAEADFQLLQYAEYLLASAIGAASSRLVLSLLLRKRTVSTKAALKLLDDANAAIHYNREILQTALDHVGQGIAVFDKELTLVCWNRQFGEIFDLPHELTRVGIALDGILRHIARHGEGHDDVGAFIAARIAQYTSAAEPFLERFAERGLVIEVRSNRMPDGGLVTTFTDITPSVKAAEALERANATLERRVRERTGELTRLNAELGRAKAEADDANVSKTRFVAAASHDILQPLNAARLYVTSLIERQRSGEDADLVQNIDASLEAVEEIFGALLDISRLDTGAMKPEIGDFRIDELLHRLEVEFAPLARAKNLDLVFMPCSLNVRSDRRLLRRLLQNLISNAIKYTPAGRVLVGCRRRGARLRIEVYDTGIGIPSGKRRAVFKEFHRLDQGARVARGVGLGLSIVERIARVLDGEVVLKSNVGRGSRFSIDVPRGKGLAGAPKLRAVPRVDVSRLDGTTVLCIDNEHAILDGMQTLLGGWGCRTLKAADLTEALAAIDASGVDPDGFLVDYHLDGGNGIAAIVELRRRFGRQVPAILITADRSLHVREEARAEGAHLLNKPIKPASLRALITQWRVQRVAAE